jgi:cell division protein FtsI (penicillin-binding protein 3)
LNPEFALRDYFKVKSGFSQRSKKRTASKLYSKDFSMAGKQEQRGELRKAGGVGKYYASSLGYFPAEEPKYSCIVVVHKPSTALNNYYGADVAGPVFKRIAQKNFYRCAFNK